MSRALETLLMLCRCLERPECGPQIRSEGLPTSTDQWRAVINLANYQCLTPALWAALEEKDATGNLPEDARDFLEEVRRRNRDRNFRIRDQGVELFATFG